MPAKSPRPTGAALPRACAAMRRLDVLGRDEAVLLDRVEVDAVLLRQLDRLARGVGGAGWLGRRGLLGRDSSTAASSASLSAITAMRPAQLDLVPLRVQVMEDPVAGRLDLERAFDVSTTHTGWPFSTRSRSADEPLDEQGRTRVFASSRVRTISSSPSAPDVPSCPHGARRRRPRPGATASSSVGAAGMIPSRAAIRRTGARQVVPRLALHASRDLGADAARQRPLLDRDERPRAGDGLEHRLEVERQQPAERRRPR